MSRDAYAAEPSTGAFVSGWSHSENGTTGATISGKNASARLQLQDYYSVENKEAKIASIKNYVDLAASAEPGVWTINHTSGYTGTIGSDLSIKQNAENNNVALYDYLTDSSRPSGSTGIILLDHAGLHSSGIFDIYGDLLPQAIIDNNFAFPLSLKGE